MITALRWIERDGEKVLQQKTDKPVIRNIKGYATEVYWQDVPLVEENDDV